MPRTDVAACRSRQPGWTCDNEPVTNLLLRHGQTGFRTPEGWRGIPLNQAGRQEAEAAGQWLQDHASELPTEITRLVSSPLPRATETAGIVGRVLGLDVADTWPEARAFDGQRETAARYRQRSEQVLQRLQAEEGVALIGHRSFSSYLATHSR
jgi:broad specificity phosphatase PhoE